MLYQYENSWPGQHYHSYQASHQGYQGHSYYSYDQAATGCTVVGGNQYYGQQQQGCKTTYQFDGHHQRSPSSGGSTSTSYQGYSAVGDQYAHHQNNFHPADMRYVSTCTTRQMPSLQRASSRSACTTEADSYSYDRTYYE